MKISELALRQPVTVQVDATLVDTAEVMAGAGVGSVIVLDGASPVGIVTDRDIVTRGVARGYPGDGRIDGLMSMGLIAVEAGDDVEELTHLFRDHAIRRVPVVDHDRIVGLVALDDMLVFTIEALHDVSTVLAGQIMFPHAADEAQTPATSG